MGNKLMMTISKALTGRGRGGWGKKKLSSIGAVWGGGGRWRS